MESRKNLRQSSAPPSTFEQIERMHPHKMLIWLAVIGSTLIFTFLLVAFAYTHVKRGSGLVFTFPKAFVVSTFLLMMSSFTIKGVVRAFRQDELPQVRWQLLATIVLGLGFVLSQVLGWLHLFGQKISLSKAVGVSYLYALSGLHILHILAALSYLVVVWYGLFRIRKDAVKSLIVQTNPYQLIRVEIATILWHYMDIVWFVLFFYFLFTF